MTTTDLAARYGDRAPQRQRLLLVVAGLVVLSFAGWLAWATVVQADPEVASGNLTYDDDGATENRIVARFTVEMGDDVDEATCTLEARATDPVALVGSISFTVPRGTTRVEQAIATERQAAQVELIGCTAPGQSRPR